MRLKACQMPDSFFVKSSADASPRRKHGGDDRLLLGRNLLLAFIAAATVGRAEQEGDFAYVSDGAQITITGYSGADDAISIPAVIGGLPVTAIGDRAFYQGRFSGVTIPTGVTHIGIQAFSDCLWLTSVAIPGGVTNIGHSAFYQCQFLTGVTLPESLATLGDHAFYCCGLTGVTIPDSVTSIGTGAFALDYGLEQIMIGRGVSHIGEGVFAYTALATIAVDPANPSYCAPDGVLYDKAQTMLLAFPPSKSGTYDIPVGVTAIGASAFTGCFGLTGVSIPETVAAIGKKAFSGCASLTGVTIPSGVAVIEDNAFSQSGLTGVTIPDGVTAIGEAAFAYC
ncbi:MAG: leucine-rich repeat domain-containing protein, partial [Lentisphaerae bacterium]|nr:leucine-rich repeat domain-containing protein [Lentisphaerota bacterium]